MILYIFSSFSLWGIIILTFSKIPDHWLCDYHVPKENFLSRFSLSSRKQLMVILFFTFFVNLFVYHVESPFMRVLYWIMLVILIQISIADILYMIIPDQHIILIFGLGLLILSKDSFVSQLIGLFMGALPFLAVLILGILLKNTECIGFGDIKLMSALGFLAGVETILKIYMVSCLLAGFFSFFTIISKVGKDEECLKSYMPLAPCICLSSVLCIFL